MDDIISRREAIDAVHKEFDECLVWDESGKHTADEVERVLADVPSAVVGTQMSLADCISRESAIDAVCEYCEYCEYFYNEKVIQSIKEIPSAQPEHLVKESGNLVNGLVNDCISRQEAKVAMRKLKKWYVVCEEHTQKNIGIRFDDVMFTLDKLPSAQPEPCEDTISRKAAIDALEREKTYSAAYKYGYTQTDYFKQYNMGLTDGIKALNKLPSAQPEHLVKESGNLVKGLVNDCISRKAALDALAKFVPYAICDESTESYTNGLTDAYYLICRLPSEQPERMTNRQWIDFLSAQFDISRTSAKEMLHGMMRWKKEDNFKKMFNGGKT